MQDRGCHGVCLTLLLQRLLQPLCLLLQLLLLHRHACIMHEGGLLLRGTLVK
jgi:NAD-dependent oxidoreductase involved in siderophore biosynthesis